MSNFPRFIPLMLFVMFSDCKYAVIIKNNPYELSPPKYGLFKPEAFRNYLRTRIRGSIRSFSLRKS